MKPLRILPLALGVLLLATSARAQDFGQDFTQMPAFTSAELDRFLKDWPAFTQWTESRGEELDQSGNEDAWTREAAQFVADLGWPDHERFFYVAHQCAVGVSDLSMDSQIPSMLEQLDKTRRSILDDPTMNEEQKRQMLEALEQSKGSIMGKEEEPIPAQEMTLIRAHEAEIRRVMQTGE